MLFHYDKLQLWCERNIFFNMLILNQYSELDTLFVLIFETYYPLTHLRFDADFASNVVSGMSLYKKYAKNVHSIK